MKIHYIMHASFETLGSIADWAIQNNHSLSCTKTYDGEQLPNVSEFDFLIVMGGPQSPIEIEKFPYLKDEIEFISKAIKQNKIVLGFCLGAQLIAEALGAKTQRSPKKEVGSFPIELTEEGLKDSIFKNFPKTFDVIHWHNDMPGLPEGAVLLAKSEGCPRQAFRYGDRVYGFQCHLEPKLENIKEMIANCPGDLKPSQFTQTAEDMLKSDFKKLNQRMRSILDSLTQRYQS